MKAPCSVGRGEVWDCPLAQTFQHPCKVTPMSLFRDGDPPGVPGEKGVTGWLFLCRKS